jgi:hypothetical protein
MQLPEDDEIPARAESRLWMHDSDPSALVCDARAVPPGLDAVDALARLHLNARRLGLDLRIRHASSELEQLIALAGLDEVLCVEASGEPEEGEDRVGVEEERQLNDPAGL